MEPHAVDNFCHVACPICLIHSLDLVFGEDLLMNAALVLIPVVIQFTWLVKQCLIECRWEYFVGVFSVRKEVLVARCLSSDFLFCLEGLKKSRFLSMSFLFRNFVKKDYLFVVYRSAERTRFNEVAEVGCLGKFVDESVRSRCFFVCPKFLIVEEILGLGVVIDGLTRAHAWVF